MKRRLLLAVMIVATGLGACTRSETAAQPTQTRTADATSSSTRIFRNAEGIAIGGYDPISYFGGAPMPGRPDITSVVDGATFLFASAANKEAFDANPAAYLPQYGGYCAYGASQGVKFPTIPETGTVVGGKLYFNKNRDVQALWNKDQEALIEKADAQWPSIENDKPRG